MKKQELIKIIKTYKDEYKDEMFKAADAAARTQNEEELWQLSQFENAATAKYEAMMALLQTIEVVEAEELRATGVWKTGMITASERDWLVDSKMMEEVKKEGDALHTVLDDELDFSCGIKEWYHKKYKTDEMYEEIRDYVTFGDVFTAFQDGKDFYRTIGVGDSVIRERVFAGLVKVLNNDLGIEKYTYWDIYEAWLHKTPIVSEE